MELISIYAPTFECNIHIGCYEVKHICRAFALEYQLCVSVIREHFYYEDHGTIGEENGYKITLLQFPKRIRDELELVDLSFRLANQLIRHTPATTALIVTPHETFWIGKENENKI